MNKNISYRIRPILLSAFTAVAPCQVSALDFHHLHLEEDATLNNSGHAFNHICRDRLDGTRARIPNELFERLERVESYFERQGWRDLEFQIVSCYRSPETNELFRRQGRNVAKNSQHVQGNAFDFALEGTLNGLRRAVPVRDVWRVACAITKAKGYGGVGYYPNDGFVHMDVRRDRFSDWGASCP